MKLRLWDWFSSFNADISFEMRDVQVTVGDDLAYCHSLNHVDATTTEGTPFDMWWRTTLGFRKAEDRWTPRPARHPST